MSVLVMIIVQDKISSSGMARSRTSLYTCDGCTTVNASKEFVDVFNTHL